MTKRHVKQPSKFDAAILAERQQEQVQRYLADSLPYGGRSPVERHTFTTYEEAAAFLLQAGKNGRSIFHTPFKYCPGYWPVALMKQQADIDADIAQIKADIEAEYQAELEADRAKQVALLIEQQEAQWQKKETERLEAERQARLAEFRKTAEEVL